MRHMAASGLVRLVALLISGAVLSGVGGCDSLFNGTLPDVSLDGTWTTNFQSPTPDVTIPPFTLVIANGAPSSVSMPFLPAPLNALTIPLDGKERGVPGVALFKAGGTLTRDGSAVTIVLTTTLTYMNQTAEGTLTLSGTVVNDTITGTATATGSLPGMTFPATGTTAFTMTRQ